MGSRSESTMGARIAKAVKGRWRDACAQLDSFPSAQPFTKCLSRLSGTSFPLCLSLPFLLSFLLAITSSFPVPFFEKRFFRQSFMENARTLLAHRRMYISVGFRQFCVRIVLANILSKKRIMDNSRIQGCEWKK